MSSSSQEHESVSLFRKYLRIPSVHPNVNYEECVTFFVDVANDLNLPIEVITLAPKNPIVIITWTGTNPELPSVLLNSHMDVVPVFPEKWTYPPFGAEKDKDGNIYARGTQDMKCVGIQHIETIKRYMKEGIKLKRTIHLSFMPDEEVGGVLGMKLFINSDQFKKLNVGIALDEGVASENDDYYISYAERSSWKVKITCPGVAGHGSLFHENTAMEKVQYVINKLMQRRNEEKIKMSGAKEPITETGNVSTINITMINGGVQANVMPSQVEMIVDIRLAIDVNVGEFKSQLQRWCKEAGSDVQLDVLVENTNYNPTRTDNTNPFWVAIESSCQKLGINLKKFVMCARSDISFIRNVGIPAFGFSPMNNTKILLHDHDEYLNEKVFLRGLDIFYEIIQNVANV